MTRSAKTDKPRRRRAAIRRTAVLAGVAVGATVMSAALGMTLGPAVAGAFAVTADAERPLLAAVSGLIAALAVWPAAWAVTVGRAQRAERSLLAVRRELAKAKRAAHETRRNRPQDLIDFAALTADGDRDRRRNAEQVIRLFLETSPDAADRLRAAMEHGDAKAAGRHARRLRSASRTVGSLELPGMLADVEALARAGDIGGMHAAATELERAFDDLTLALKTLNARG